MYICTYDRLHGVQMIGLIVYICTYDRLHGVHMIGFIVYICTYDRLHGVQMIGLMVCTGSIAFCCMVCVESTVHMYI